MASDSEGLRRAGQRRHRISVTRVENGFRFGRVTTSRWCRHLLLRQSWKWLPIRKGYDFEFQPLHLLEDTLQLKMASDSEGLRLFILLFFIFFVLKMASDSEGLRLLFFFHPLLGEWFPLKMASDSEGLRLMYRVSIRVDWLRWKWLPIRKGYDMVPLRVPII